MANPKVTFNQKLLALQVKKDVERATLPIARQIVRDSFEAQKERVIAEIRNHPISKELEDEGRRRKRKSKFIISDRAANLFAFFGFKVSRQPVQELINLIEDRFNVNLRVRLIKGECNFRVDYMDVPELKKETPLDWSKRSWLTAVENGLTNIGYFIAKLGKGRSTGGYQAKKRVGKAEFIAVPYITPIIQKFKSTFK